MPKGYRRGERVAAILWRELAGLFQQRRNHRKELLLTISRVTLSNDLSIATVWISFFGKGIGAESLLAELTEEIPYFRGELARTLKLRLMPKLLFRYDEQLQTAARIDELLDGAKKTKPNDDSSGMP